MILVELDSVAVWWVREETLFGTIFERKNWRHYFCTDLVQYKNSLPYSKTITKRKY
jgi:hypothetical protein